MRDEVGPCRRAPLDTAPKALCPGPGLVCRTRHGTDTISAACRWEPYLDWGAIVLENGNIIDISGSRQSPIEPPEQDFFDDIPRRPVVPSRPFLVRAPMRTMPTISILTWAERNRPFCR